MLSIFGLVNGLWSRFCNVVLFVFKVMLMKNVVSVWGNLMDYIISWLVGFFIFSRVLSIWFVGKGVDLSKYVVNMVIV